MRPKNDSLLSTNRKTSSLLINTMRQPFSSIDNGKIPGAGSINFPRQLTTNTQSPAWRLLILFFCNLLFQIGSPAAEAGSAIELLSGFDRARIQRSFPPHDQDSLGDLCKLIYRLRGVEQKTLDRLASEAAPQKTGDAIQKKGILIEVKRVEVPEALQEYLSFQSLYFLQLTSEENVIRVITSRFPSQAKAGDQIQATGIFLQSESDPNLTAIASGSVGWFANREMSDGEKLLQAQNFDLSLLAGLKERNRLPLMAQDGDAFYSILAKAHQLSGSPSLPKPRPANPVTFLRDGKNTIAEWIQMEVEGVQITKIAVPSLERQKQLGKDHYFQVDAIGDLGEVVVKVEPAAGEKTAVFRTRYPVSIVVRDLPEFLRLEPATGDIDRSVVRPIRGKISVEGFFFRLWSYESEFMQQNGGDSQFGPLLIAATLRDLEPQSVRSIGVEKIGTAAAGVILFGIVAIWLWLRRLAQQDREVKQQRLIQEAESVNLNLDSLSASDQEQNQAEIEA